MVLVGSQLVPTLVPTMVPAFALFAFFSILESPMRKLPKSIPLLWPTYHGKELQRVFAELFPADMSNRWLGQAHKVDEFEREFGKKYGFKYCVAVNSCTAALELAYHMIGFKKGDEVITPVLTCTATNVWFLRNGVKIVFADIKKNLTIDPVDVERKITRKTKAIVVVTLGGIPVDKRLYALAKKHRLPVVVDAAQSLGVGEPDGDFVAYSFQATKHFTTGDGGILVLRNEKDYRRAKKLRWYGIDREMKAKANWQPYQKRQMTMDIEEPGYKFHMNDVTATLGLVGLKHADASMKHRKKIVDYYNAHLKMEKASGGSLWLYAIFVDDRDHIAAQLKAAGIETNLIHLRNDIFKAFGHKRLPLPVMDSVEHRYLYIPLHTRMTLDDARYVVKTINAALAPHLRPPSS